MKKFEVPEMNVITFMIQDVITTSGGGSVNPPGGITPPGENETPDW